MTSFPARHRVRSFPEIQEAAPHRLFVFAESRSGSTWLITTLASHPDLGMLDEVINPDFARNLRFPTEDKGTQPVAPIQLIENQLSTLPGTYKGCKVLFPQAIRFIDFYEFILNYREARFILLTRRNSVRAEISGLIANEHARWHLAASAALQPVTVDPQFLYERLQWRKFTRAFCVDLIETYCCHFLHLEYRDLFDSPANALDTISSFLSVPAQGYQYSSEIKTNPFPLSDLITNYQECTTFFNDREGYAHCFSDDEFMDNHP